MLETFLSHFQFANALIAMIAIIELLINFKKPIPLKILLLIFLSTIVVINLTLLLKFGHIFNAFSKIILPLAGIHIFYYLYNFKINKKLIIFTGVCILQLSLNLYSLYFTDSSHYNFFYWARRINRILLSLGILALYFITYFKMLKSLDDKNHYSTKIENWIKLAVVLFTVAILNNLSILIFSPNSFLIKIISSFVHLTCCILVIFRPDFLNRTELSYSLGNIFRKTIEDQIDAEKFVNEFYSKTYFIQKETSVDDLANKMMVPASKLNDYIYETTKMSFIDLVNKNRVEYFISLVSSGKFSDYTIEALAELSGFGSRQSLYRNFKKFHGGNPSDFHKIINN